MAYVKKDDEEGIIIKDGEKYYTLEKSSKMLDDYIEKSADLLIKELRERRKLKKSKQEQHV